ncbi:LysR family transcriptional regulator [Desulfobotulus sp. H1]|uniref:LysR family transcriptional regulator n=1 Tax=Desulfobotulus pelophilus TaxID=2823377 RepID=A0ABT3ND55_9BACT|nr:LysR family transcriptional regulator [Desulfobotulus pelophilus]MCW7755394.1 LysR family transcriptional regulator [Desulfobotulus pelophilus]
MELYHLKTFVAVAEEQHLTKASRRLFISPPAVSTHIKALEEELSVCLFNRTPRGMELTEEGRRLKTEAEKLLLSVESFVDSARVSGKKPTGRFRMGYSSNGAFLRIPETVLKIFSLYPGLMIKLEYCLSAILINALEEREIDVGFYFGNDNPAGVELCRLKTLDLMIIAPLEWKESLTSASLSELSDYPWIWASPDCSFRKVANTILSRKRLSLCQSVVVDDEITCRNLVRAGIGLALVLENDAREAEKEGAAFIWDKKNFQINLSLAWLEERKHEPAIEAITALIRELWSSSFGLGG